MKLMSDPLIHPVGQPGPRFPTGTVTFLFTDIEGSTKLSQEYPEAMPALLKRHDEILTQSIEAHDGHIFRNVGDSFCAAFSSAVSAVNAALRAQGLLQHEAWAPAPVKVRMGIHTGAVQLSSGNEYSGYTTLALCQRVMAAGYGGQVLLSSVSRELVRDSLPEESNLLDLGERRLKDMLRPEHLYQLIAPGLQTTFPALKTLDSFPNNLPAQLTSFIGREKEISDVKRELSDHRLITLTGSGGTGKTRLSLQVASELLDQFPHGIWFVELAPLSDLELIPQAVLSTIGLNEQAGKPAMDLLVEYLRDRRSLIVLDNCEHLIDASAKVAHALLKAAPELKILASSREALGVRGELSYPVPSLSSPDIKKLPQVEKLSQYEAVRLFIDRASLVLPNFVVDKDNAPFIAQICYRLDGIPLAIELAAARVKMLSVEQISNRLDDRFRLLTGGARTALPRQQTLRALIDWSYDILSEDERLLLCRFSVFSGGWSIEAAEEICAGDNIDSYDVLELLTQLVNKSLVFVTERPETDLKPLSSQGDLRYRLLETIKQYGREKLMEAGEAETIRARHFEYYLKMARQLLSEFFGPKELVWMVWLDEEWDNIRAAVEWSLESRPDAGLEMVNCLGYLSLDNLNNMTDMLNWLWELLANPANSARTAARALGLLHWSWYANANYERYSTQVQAMNEESVSIYEELGDKNGLAHAYVGMALTSPTVEVGKAYFGKGITLLRETNDRVWIAYALRYFGWMLETEDYASKLAALEESLAIYRKLGFTSGIIEALKQLGALAIREGNFELAHLRLDEGLSILQANSYILGNSITMSYDLGDLAYYEGDDELAKIFYENCLAWASQKCLPHSAAWANARLGYLYKRLGENEKARVYYREALKPNLSGNSMEGVSFILEGLASLAVSEGQCGKALKLFSWSTGLREWRGEFRAPVEQTAVDRDLAAIRSLLSDDEFYNFYGEGSRMSMHQALALALEERDG
jgi:predicted ATPase/class 3 adenylate cyclase